MTHRRPKTAPTATLPSTNDGHPNSTLGLVPFHPTSYTPSSRTKRTTFEHMPLSSSNSLPSLLKGFADDSVLPSDHLSSLLEEVNSRIKAPTYNLPEYDLTLQQEQEQKMLASRTSKKLLELMWKAPRENLGMSLLNAKGKKVSKPKRSQAGGQSFDVTTLFPTYHKRSKEAIKKTIKKALDVKAAKLKFYKPTRRPPPTIAPIFSATSIINNSYQTYQEVEYLAKFGWDKHLYRSKGMWAEKTIAEARELTESPTCMNHNVFVAVLTHLLLTIERTRGSMDREEYRFLFDNILRSVFILGSGSKATNQSTLELLERRKSEAFRVPPGKEGERAILKIISKCPTWFSAVQYWRQRYEKELQLQPYLQKLREKMDREKKIENGVLNRTCTAWTRPYMSLVIDNWKSVASLDHNLHLLGKYLLKCTELKPSMIFGAWKKWSTNERLKRADEDKDKVLKAWDLLKMELADTLARVSKKQVAFNKLVLENKKVQKKLDAALAILNSPPRQPPTLAKTVKR